VSIRVSLKQVAEAAGVSISTVSQALRGSGRISIKTREAVEKVAERLGYRPDPLISQFASRKFHHESDLIGTTLLFVTGSLNPASQAVPLYHASFKKRAERLGFRFEHFELPLQFDYLKLQKQWFYRGVRGIAFANVMRCQWVIEEPTSDFSVVCIGGNIRRLTYHAIKSEVSTAVIGVWEKARQRGYERIGFALCRHRNDILDDRLRLGMARELSAKAGSPIPVHDGALDDPKPFKAWLKKYRPDAVIGFPRPVCNWIEAAGLRVPQDCAVLMTTIEQDDSCAGWVENHEAIASRAADLLDAMIRHGDAGMPSPPTVTLVEGCWNEGITAPPIRQSVVQPLSIVR
jgi:LacI family transcriptional regulator